MKKGKTGCTLLTSNFRRISSRVVAHSRQREQPFEKLSLQGQISQFCWQTLSLKEESSVSTRLNQYLTKCSKGPCKRTQNCWMLHVASVCTPCCILLRVAACSCVLLGVVAQSLKPVKILSQQLPTLVLFCDRQSVAQQCWVDDLRSSSNIVGATHTNYTWSP